MTNSSNLLFFSYIILCTILYLVSKGSSKNLKNLKWPDNDIKQCCARTTSKQCVHWTHLFFWERWTGRKVFANKEFKARSDYVRSCNSMSLSLPTCSQRFTYFTLRYKRCIAHSNITNQQCSAAKHRCSPALKWQVKVQKIPTIKI